MASTSDPSTALLNGLSLQGGREIPLSLQKSLLPPSEQSPISNERPTAPNQDKEPKTLADVIPSADFSDADTLDTCAPETIVDTIPSSEGETQKIRPVPLHLANSSFFQTSETKVPSSPQFRVRVSPWNQRNRKMKSSPKPHKVQSKVPREKRRRITNDMQHDLYASVAALKQYEDGSFPVKSQSVKHSPPKLSPSKLSPLKPRHSDEDKLRENRDAPPHSLTLWGYLMLELASQKNEVFTEEKTEQLLNFARVPLYLERVIIFGTLTCLDSFLHFFTILPLRFFYAIYVLLRNLVKGVKQRLPSSRKADIIKGLIFTLTLSLLLQLDTSKIYHNIRGQSAIKLYVMFNVLEIADKLFSALGQDILECLFSYETLNRNYKDEFARRYFQPVVFAILGIVYIYFHSLVILYQIITLNVAVNSYSNALLTLLLSNQFAEIKAAVFKKFERENLFQLTCADITERFQLTIMLFIIGMRNIVEVSNAGLVPRSWSGWNRWLGAMMGPMIVVVGSEICVDWLKHAYIAKFNNIRPKVYRKFLDVLAYDYSENSFSDDIMTKRVGIPIFPIASVFFRMLLQSYSMLAEHRSPRVAPIKASFTPTPTSILQTPNATADMATSTTLFQPPNSAPFPLNILDEIITTGRLVITPYIPTISIDTDAFYLNLSLVLVSITVFLLLFALKLILGLFLLQYSTHRRAKLISRPLPAAAAPPPPPAVKLHRSSQAAQSMPSRSRAQSQSQPQSNTRAITAPATAIDADLATGSHKPTAVVSAVPRHGSVGSTNQIAQSGYYDDSDESDHIPGPIKGGQGLIEIPKHLREKLYFPEESVPPLKGRKSNVKEFRDLLSVRRFKMAAKQIW